MSTLISPDDLREHCESDLGDAALQRIIDDSDAAIVERFGPHAATEDAPETEQHYGGGVYLYPRRKVASVVTLTEYIGTLGGAETDYELVAGDYRIENGGLSLLRLVSGTTPRSYWGARVVLKYLPVTDYSRRQRVEIDLCKLALGYNGYIKSERAGDYSAAAAMSPDAYQAERERLLSELVQGVVFA